MSSAPSGPPQPAPEEKPKHWLSPSQRSKLLLTAGAAASFALVGWISKAMHVPAFPGYDGSLLQQPSALLAIGLAAVALVGLVVVGTALAPLTHFNAGLFIGAIGWAAFSARGGSIRAVLQNANGSAGIFGRLALEIAALFLILGFVWVLIWALHKADVLREPVRAEDDAELSASIAHHIPGATPGAPLGGLLAGAFRFLFRESADPKVPAATALTQRIGAVLLQVLVTSILMMLLAASTDKQQVLAALAISAFFGAAAAEYAFPKVSPGALAWLGLLITGLIGYVAAGANPEGLLIADPRGALAPLARALPIDYASVGVAGALAGLWGGVSIVKAGHELVSKGTTTPPQPSPRRSDP